MKNIIEETGERIVPILHLSRMQSKAVNYRLSNNHHGGYCVFFNGKIEGWKAKPDNPNAWKPKTLLIGADLDEKSLPTVYINCGGNVYDGGDKWERIDF